MPTPCSAASSAIQILGNHTPGGIYILRIQISQDLEIRFGRFRQATPVEIGAGVYLYIGSAMGNGGAPLGRRIVRHLTRCESLPPHPLRQRFIAAYTQKVESPADLLPRRPKRLHWHIDYLLDQLESDVTGVIARYSRQRLEATVAARLAADPSTSLILPGLGASDNPGATHLLRLDGNGAWWQALGRRLAVPTA